MKTGICGKKAYPRKPSIMYDRMFTSIPSVLYGLLACNMDCRKALEYGNATGAVKNTIPGDMSSLQMREIDYIIKDHHSTGKVAEMER